MSPIARALLAAMFALACLPADAQSTARPRPPGSMPLEDIPPPPPAPPVTPEEEAKLRPTVTERTEGDNTIQEYRVGGKLYMQRVTPKHGHPYVLLDQRGDGTFTKFDNPLDPGIRVPQWVILEF